jgi:leucyl/phenylalanyl-tRNA---protein transferase
VTELTSELLLKAYAFGVFPMAKSRDDRNVFWVQPKLRGIIPLESFHVSHSLRKTLRRQVFEVTINRAFGGVMAGCAETTPNRPDTWINDQILRLFTELHQAGVAHSVEVWRNGKLAGGLYGLAMGSAFFGESMFSRETDASKVALVHLVARLIEGNYRLLDTQFLTDHLAHFGTVEIPRTEYLERLRSAIAAQAYWSAPSGSGARPSLSVESGDLTLTGARDATIGAATGALVLQKITHTS